MLIKYEQIFVNYIPFLSVLADLSNSIWQSVVLVDYKKIQQKTGHFYEKIPIFSNFGRLGRVQDIKIFEKLFDIFKAHIKRQLLVALNSWYRIKMFFDTP